MMRLTDIEESIWSTRYRFLQNYMEKNGTNAVHTIYHVGHIYIC
jgi:hypothetical protein